MARMVLRFLWKPNVTTFNVRIKGTTLHYTHSKHCQNTQMHTPTPTYKHIHIKTQTYTPTHSQPTHTLQTSGGGNQDTLQGVYTRSQACTFQTNQQYCETIRSQDCKVLKKLTGGRERWASGAVVARPTPMRNVRGSRPSLGTRIFKFVWNARITWGWWLSRPSDETINRGPVCVRIQNIKHAL
jgi:hypothetical protein